MNTSEIMKNLIKPNSTQPEVNKLFTLSDFSKGDPFQKKSSRPTESVQQLYTNTEIPFHIREDKLHPIESIFDISVDEGDAVQVSFSNITPANVMELPTMPILMPIMEGYISL